jgi:hypothetical protein
LLEELGIDLEQLFFKRIIRTQDVDFVDAGTSQIFSSKDKEIKFNEQLGFKIEERYSKHKGLILNISYLNNKSLIQGIKHAQGRLILYDYHSDVKY